VHNFSPISAFLKSLLLTSILFYLSFATFIFFCITKYYLFELCSFSFLQICLSLFFFANMSFSFLFFKCSSFLFPVSLLTSGFLFCRLQNLYILHMCIMATTDMVIIVTICNKNKD